MKPYSNRMGELSVESGCVLWGTRVIIPPSLQSKVIDEIHEGHPGIGRMKSFACSYVWWPGLDKAVEDRMRKCVVCQRAQKMPARVPIQPLGVAGETLVMAAHRSCWSYLGEDDPDRDRCSLQVDRGTHCTIDFGNSSHRQTKINLRNTRSTANQCVR